MGDCEDCNHPLVRVKPAGHGREFSGPHWQSCANAATPCGMIATQGSHRGATASGLPPHAKRVQANDVTSANSKILS